MDSRNPEVWYKRGLALLRSGQPDRAVDDLSEALRLDPDCFDAMALRALAFGDAGYHLTAITEFDRAIALRPLCAPLHFNRGRAYEESGQSRRAGWDYRRAFWRDPTGAVGDDALAKLEALEARASGLGVEGSPKR
jgi:tetratricopeptide (TPR) repeat protein